jgi:hypothetical protein
MELFGRRWDRWDAIVAVAAVMLIVVSYRPWWALRAGPLTDPVQPPQMLRVTIWNAWQHWQWSNAVALGVLAAGVHLAYRSRPEARAAAWLAVLMLLPAIGLVGWQWHKSSGSQVRAYLSRAAVPSAETRDGYQRRMEEHDAYVKATSRPVPTRSVPQTGIYAAAGSLILMLAATGRGLVASQPRRATTG